MDNTIIRESIKNEDKVSLGSKISYGLAEAGSQFSWTLVSSYLTVFYTDIVGLTPLVISIIMLVARIWDAFNDPVMGMIAERTNSRWGRFRPYLLWGSPVLALFNVLTFTNLDISQTGKTIFCTLTYMACGSAYAACSICTGALANVMTNDNNERMSLNAWRGILGGVAGLVISGATMPIILHFGKGNASSSKGYFMAALLYSVLSMILFWIAFAGSKEVITIPVSEKKVKVTESLKIALGDRNTRLMLYGMVLFLTGIFGRLGVMLYYYIYVLGRPDLISSICIVLTVSMMLPNFFVPAITRKINKKIVIAISCVICALGCLVLYMSGYGNIPLAYIGTFMLGAGNWVGLCNFGLVAEIIDDTEVRNNVRADGTIYSCISFSTKIGSAIGGSIGILLLSAVGYVANASQTEAAKVGMNIVINLGPGLMFLLAIIPFLLIKMTNKKGEENSEILKVRRAQ